MTLHFLYNSFYGRLNFEYLNYDNISKSRFWWFFCCVHWKVRCNNRNVINRFWCLKSFENRRFWNFNESPDSAHFIDILDRIFRLRCFTILLRLDLHSLLTLIQWIIYTPRDKIICDFSLKWNKIASHNQFQRLIRNIQYKFWNSFYK